MSASGLVREERGPETFGLDAEVLGTLAARLGPLAVVDLETTGLSEDPEANILEFGAVLIDPGADHLTTLSVLVDPGRAVPRAVKRLTGIDESDLEGAPALEDVADELRRALRGRVLIAHNAEFEQAFLTRDLSPDFARATFLDTLDLLSLTHPDAPDLRLESFTRMMFETEERHRALSDALDTTRVVSAAGRGARRGELRFVTARRALESYAHESPWLELLAKPEAEVAPDPVEQGAFIAVGHSDEPPVPFHEDAIAEVLRDESRGRRHFPGYRVREQQIQLARRFARNLADEEVLLLEGGTGVGKSLAYLAALIPFAMEREAAGESGPLVVSTRTKLLQDQLLYNDIGAAARFLGYPELRAASIKGRANYACARRLSGALAEGREQSIFAEDRMAYAVLETCARTRPHGEIGNVPAALIRRYPPLRGLLRRAVAARAEQCTREQCVRNRDCPLGRKRQALGEAHLIVANHDLLLRWPPDYPPFEHVVADEAHELGDVADEVYAQEVRPDLVIERFDEIFGRPAGPRRRRGESLLSAEQRKGLESDARAWRRDLQQDLTALGRCLREEAGDFGEVQIPGGPQRADGRGGREPIRRPAFDQAAGVGSRVADRLELIADRIPAADESAPALQRAVADLLEAASGLRLAFEDPPDAVAAFEGVLPPYDRWRLVVRPVSPAEPFHAGFLQDLRSFAGVSASLFVGGDAFASLGDLELEERAGERLQRDRVESPFPYREHMRVVGLRGSDDPVRQTADVLELLARTLGGRTLGLFTSLRRMNAVADELALRLRDEGIDVLTPRRAADDPAALVTRFTRGAAVLLGARRFWQGVDIPGDALQAVVIEKLPFEVPTELRRRRDDRLEAAGTNPFQRVSMGRMLLNLKQMVGRLIRSEDDRGIAVIVDSRPDKFYFRRLAEALPPGSRPIVAQVEDLPRLLREVGIETAPDEPG
ncbi:MAG: helicase C-terminal domain-containing protein [Myxococcota bacterium]|nr:helicase C-terminal domain-containing protein [Myxococcota bacterium]